MFDSLWSWFPHLNDPQIGAVGDPNNKCAPDLDVTCGRVNMMHQGVINLPNGDLSSSSVIKVLKPVRFEGYGKPTLLTSEGPSFTETGKGDMIFSFTGRVDPSPAIVDGVRVDWSAPPDGARVLVSPSLTGKLHEATGWIVTKAEGRIPGGLPQSQDIIFSHPENVRRIEIQMRDAPNSFKTQFGISHVSLVTNAKDVLSRAF